MAKKLSVYLVGGAVRDELLGRPVVDRDWVVIGARPEDLLALGYRQIGREFPCFLHPDTKDEYALARTERKSGRGHTGFVCDFGPQVTLEEDLRRRDLTINAIAKTADGRTIDPYGGRADLEARVLRHVSDAFAEDPLRVLRVARFAARYAELGFRVHHDTLKLMSSLVSADEMSELTPERVWKEISSALTEPQPSVFFRVLLACGALGILLPEIDTGDQVMTAVDTARREFDTPVVTWAALMRDLGDVALVKAVAERLKIPRDFKELAALVCEHHARCRRLPELRPEAVLQLLEAVDGIRRPERLRHFAQACAAERLIALGEVARAVEIQPLLDQGYEGLELAEQIRRLRVVALARKMNEGC